MILKMHVIAKGYHMKQPLLIGLLAILNCFSLKTLCAEEEHLIIKLATESQLAPLYLLPMSQEQTDLQDLYIQQLEKILAFDLDHNGATFIVKRTLENNQLGLTGPFNQLGPRSSWKEKHIFYVIKPQIQGRSIQSLILDVQEQSLKHIDPLPLTGDLNEDRRQIHRLADIIYKALFGAEGIASTRILYTIKTQNSKDSRQWISEVWEADYDGGNPRQLTQERSTCVTPIYLPPKPGFATGGFVYVSYQLGQPKIYIASLKDGKKRRLTSLTGNQLMPAISQQRDKVAFICDITGNPDLFLQPFSPEKGAIGKPQQIFSARLATQGSPTFSPDGSRIAFVSNKDGSPKIYVIQIPSPGTNIKDIKATLISKINRENTAPAWSPDGTKIAYCARGQGDRQIWLYDFNTNQETQITQGRGNKENPAWAPDSLHLVFNSSDPKSSELFIMNLNQMEATQITFGPGAKNFPNWEPRFK
jgi:TolB protein